MKFNQVSKILNKSEINVPDYAVKDKDGKLIDQSKEYPENVKAGEKLKKKSVKKRPTFKEDVDFYLNEGNIIDVFKNINTVNRTKSNQLGEFYNMLKTTVSKKQPIKVAKIKLKDHDGFKINRSVKLDKKTFYFPESVFKLKVEPYFKNYKNVSVIASVDTDEK
jgi:hypothetical protein